MKGDRDTYRMVGRYVGMATLLPVSGFVGYGIGYYLDRWLGTQFMSLVFLLLGVAAGIISLIRELNRDTREK